MLSLAAYTRLASSRLDSDAAAPLDLQPDDPSAPRFSVLCRIDAYADYVAVVEANSPEDAARLAADEPEAYRWEFQQTAEFAARMYVTLDDNGNEIDGTEVDDS